MDRGPLDSLLFPIYLSTRSTSLSFLFWLLLQVLVSFPLSVSIPFVSQVRSPFLQPRHCPFVRFCRDFKGDEREKPS